MQRFRLGAAGEGGQQARIRMPGDGQQGQGQGRQGQVQPGQRLKATLADGEVDLTVTNAA